MDDLREEIGDHIFEGVFLAQVAAEERAFTIDDSLRAVVEKLLRRHPHVFQEDGRVHDAESKERAPSAEAALERWNTLKAQERAGSGTALNARQPAEEPAALLRAYKIGKRAASVGFEWATTKDVIAKIEEEVAELRETLEKEPDNAARAEEEMGDLLLRDREPVAASLGIEPEAALRKANEKFTKRFNRMEENFERNGPPPRGLHTG